MLHVSVGKIEKSRFRDEITEKKPVKKIRGSYGRITSDDGMIEDVKIQSQNKD